MSNEVVRSKFGSFSLVNPEKLNRAIFGSMSREGRLAGGVGEDASDEAIIAEYDRLGGLIKKGKYKVKTGSFYDFAKRTPRKKPEVVFSLRDLEGNEIEIGENESVPVEVQAAETIADTKAEKKAAIAAEKEARKAAKEAEKKAKGDEDDGDDA